MHRTVVGVVTLVIMIALIVGLDVAFLRDHFVLRLITNVVIVLVCGGAYLMLTRRS